MDDVAQLRTYQLAALEAVRARTVDRGILALPVGTGKGHIAGHLAESLGSRRILYLAHREELIDQLAGHVERVLGWGSVDIEQADRRAWSFSPCVIASVPTLTARNDNRLKRFEPGQFDALVCDEAHHCHVPGTLIETDTGRVPIEKIRQGDTVYAYRGGMLEKKIVLRTYAYWHDGPMYRITTGEGLSVTVTGNHQMYSKGRKVHVRRLTQFDTVSLPVVRVADIEKTGGCPASAMESSGDEALPIVPVRYAERAIARPPAGTQTTIGGMPRMREAAETEPVGRPCLHEPPGQPGQIQGSAQKGHAKAESEPEIPPTLVREDDTKQSNAQKSESGKNDQGHPQEGCRGQLDPVWQHASGRQWGRAYESRSDGQGPLPDGAMAICGSPQGRADAVSLQNRHGLAESQDRPGYRRQFAQYPKEEESRQKEGAKARFYGVETPESQQRRCILRECRIASIELQHYTGLIYDLEVADHHNYIANGLLSSNSTADTFRRIWKHFGILNEDDSKPDKSAVPLIGLTATPFRGDNVGLHNVFDDVLYQMTLQKAIEDGWLVPIYAYTIQTGVNLDDIRISRGDYAVGELSRAVATHERNEIVFDAHQKNAKGLKTLIFCVDVDHSARLAGHFYCQGVPARYVAGNMDRDSRIGTMRWFRETPGAVLTNCQIVTEGVDIPSVECVVMARPTKSSTLFCQAMGRGTRLAQGARDYAESVRLGKDRLILLDVADCSADVAHQAVSISSIFGSPIPRKGLNGENVLEEVRQQQIKFEAGEYDQPAGPVSTEAVAFNLFAQPAPVKGSRMAWIDYGGTLTLSLADRGSVRLQSDLLDRWTAIHNPRGAAGRVTIVEKAASRIEAIREAERYIEHYHFQAVPLVSKNASWRRNSPTEKQLDLCRRFNIHVPAQATRGEVSVALDRFFNRNRSRRQTRQAQTTR